MPNNVDERVVKIGFDNAEFERGTKTTLTTLEKLKESLKFKDSAKGFENLSKSASQVKLDPISNAVETVSIKFNALERIATGALMRIGQQAIDAGEKLLKSLTTDNIAAGWQKFGEKTTSVATLIGQGYDESVVEEQFKRLNWFTDETSYNLTDMIGNISKFTASGQKLDESVTAMMGIALWAAASGQNATKASQAMYQLSQAMGKGVLKYDDWRSIQNASMDTTEFRQQAVEAAIALGQLKKTGENTYQTLGKKSFTLSELFTSDALSREAWFTSDVMMKTFQKYSSAVDDLFRAVQEGQYDTASAAIEGMGDKVDAFGLKVFRAGQEARTWVDVVDSVKDAVSTGWMTTFETLIGGSTEATKVWTAMANEMYDIFAESGNARNEFLEDVFGEHDVAINIDQWSKIFESNADAAETFKMALADTAKDAGISLDEIIEQAGSFEKSLSEGWLTTDIFNKALERTGSTSKKVTKTLEEYKEVALQVRRGEWGSGSDRKAKLEEAGFSYEQVQNLVNNGGRDLSAVEKFLSEQIEETNEYTEEQIEQLKNLKSQLEDTETGVGAFYAALNSGEITGRTLLLEGLANVYKTLKESIVAVKESFSEMFPGPTVERVRGLLESFNKWSKTLREDAAVSRRITIITNIASSLFKILKTGSDAIKAVVRGVASLFSLIPRINIDFVDLSQKFSDSIGTFIDGLNVSEKISGAFEFLRNQIKKIDLSRVGKSAKVAWANFKKLALFAKSAGIALAQKFVPNLGILPDLFNKARSGVSRLVGKFQEFIENLDLTADPIKTLQSVFSKVLEKITNVKNAVVDFIRNGGFRNFFSGLSDAADEGRTTIQQFIADVKEWLNGIDWGKVMVFTLGVGLAASLAAAATALTSLGQMFVTAKTLLGTINSFVKKMATGAKNTLKEIAFLVLSIAAAIYVLVKVLEELKKFTPEELKTYGIALGIMVGGLAAIVVALGLLSKRMVNLPAVSGVFLALAASAVLLAGALKILSLIDYNGIGLGVTYLIVLFGFLTTAVIALSKWGGKDSGFGAAVTVIAMAVAIVLIAKALGEISEIPIDRLKSSMDAVIRIMVGLALVAAAAGRSGFGGVGVLGIAVSIFLVIKILKILASDEIVATVNKALENIEQIKVLFIAVAALALITRLAGTKYGFSGGLGVLAISASVLIIIEAIKRLAAISASDMRKGLSAIGLISLFFVAFSIALRLAGDNPLKAAAGIFIMAVSLLVVYKAIQKIGSLRPDVLTKGLVSITIIIGMMSLLAKSTRGAAGFGSMIGMVFILVTICGALSYLTMFSWEDLKHSVTALISVLGVLAVAMLLIGQVKIDKSGVAALIIAVTAIGVISYALYKLAEKPWESYVAPIIGIIACVGAIIGVVYAFQAVPIGPAVTAIGTFLIVLGILGVAAIAIGSLIKEFEDVDLLSMMDLGIQFASKTGEFVGSIISGLGVGLSSGLPDIGDNLASFATNATPFFDLMKTLDTSVLTGVSTLVSVIAELTGNNGFFSALGNWISDKIGLSDAVAESNLEEISSFLEGLGSALKKFDEAMGDDIDVAKISSVVPALQTITDLKSSLGNEGGLAQLISGRSGDLGTFADNLESLGTAISNFQNSLPDSIDISLFEFAKTAAGYINDLAQAIDPTGGYIQKWTGESDLATFGSRMSVFAENLVLVQEKLNGQTIEPSKFKNAADATGYINDLAQKIDPTGGYIQKWTGESNIAEFGSRMSAFIVGLIVTQRVLNTQTIEPAKFKTVLDATNYILDICNNLDRSGGFWQSVIGERDLGSFGETIISFADNLAEFSRKTGGITVTHFERIYNATKYLIDIGEAISGTYKIESLARQLPSLADGLSKFISSTKDVDFSDELLADITAVLNKTSQLVTIAKSAGNTLSNTIGESFNSSISYINVESGLLAFIGNVVDCLSENSINAFKDTGEDSAYAYIDGISSKANVARVTGIGLATDAVSGVLSQVSAFEKAGYNSVSGLLRGLLSDSNLSKLYNAGVLLGQRVLNGLMSTDSLNENSPSKATELSGRYAVLGLINGIYSMLSQVRKSGEALGSEALFGSQTAMSIIGEMAGSDVVFSPVVRPVLDLTNIQNGTKRISAIFSRNQALAAGSDFRSFRTSSETGSAGKSGTSYTFTQNNYSPKALSRQEIYRQTKNQFNSFERQMKYK